MYFSCVIKKKSIQRDTSLQRCLFISLKYIEEEDRKYRAHYFRLP